MTDKPALTEQERADLVSYLDGELEPEVARALEAKLSLDPEARAEADAMRRTWELLDYLPRPEPAVDFTHRTLDRVGALRPTATGQFRRRRWWAGIGWAAAVLVAWTIGFGAVLLYYARTQSPKDTTDEQLTRDLRVLEHYRPYRMCIDIGMIHALDHPDLFGDDLSGESISDLPPVGAAPPASTGSLPEPTSEELEQNRRLLEKWKADPDHYARLKDALGEFTALPAPEQEQLRRLDHDLHDEDSTTQARLLQILHRYNTWLDRQSEEDRERIRAAGSTAERLRLIRQLREREWIAQLPRRRRELIESSSGWLRTVWIAKLRRDERAFRQQWAQVVRPSEQTAPQRQTPAVLQLDDFPPEVQKFVYESLRPVLPEAKWLELKSAEGHGVEYVGTLMRLTREYGWAIPGSAVASRPTRPQELKALVPQPEKQEFMKELNREGKKLEGRWPDFAEFAVDLALRKHGLDLLKSKSQPWAQCRPDQFSTAVQQFIDRKLTPVLTPEEAARLHDDEGHWPRYPKTLVELADRHKLMVPEMSLPGAPEFWYTLHDHLPAVPPDTLHEFATKGLTPKEKRSLQGSFSERSNHEWLKGVYYQHHPEVLRQQLLRSYLLEKKKAQDQDAAQ